VKGEVQIHRRRIKLVPFVKTLYSK